MSIGNKQSQMIGMFILVPDWAKRRCKPKGEGKVEFLRKQESVILLVDLKCNSVLFSNVIKSFGVKFNSVLSSSDSPMPLNCSP